MGNGWVSTNKGIVRVDFNHTQVEETEQHHFTVLPSPLVLGDLKKVSPLHQNSWGVPFRDPNLETLTIRVHPLSTPLSHPDFQSPNRIGPLHPILS